MVSVAKSETKCVFVLMITAMAIIHAKTKLLVLIGDSISWNDHIWFMEDTSPWKLLDLVMTKTHLSLSKVGNR